jgi:hypothetical protein
MDYEAKLRELVLARNDPRTVDTLLRRAATAIAFVDKQQSESRVEEHTIEKQRPQRAAEWWVDFIKQVETRRERVEQSPEQEQQWVDTDSLEVCWAMMKPCPDEGLCWRLDKLARNFHTYGRREEEAWTKIVQAVRNNTRASVRAAYYLAREQFNETFRDIHKAPNASLGTFAVFVKKCAKANKEYQTIWSVERHTVG